MSNNAKFRVLWVPQVPMKPFIVDVTSREEGQKIFEVLANYDLFQFENKIKPDYCNEGSIELSHPTITNGEWWDITDDAEWDDFAEQLKAANTSETATA